MTTEVRDIGDRETVRAAFTDKDGAAANPSVVTLKIREPDGTVTIVASSDVPLMLDNPSPGTWEFGFTYSQGGRHFFEWTGTGAVVAAAPGERYVRRSHVA